MNRLMNLKFGQKLALILLLQLLPAALALVLLDRSLAHSVRDYERELAGLDYVEPVADLASAFAEHDIASTESGQGNDSFAERTAAMVSRGNEIVATLEKVDAGEGSALNASAQLRSAKDAWQRAAAAGGAAGNAHADGIERTFALRERVVMDSGLKLDRNADTTHLLQVVADDVPTIMQGGAGIHAAVQQLRDKGVGNAAGRERLAVERARVRETLERMANELAAAGKENPALAGRHDAAVGSIRTAFGEVDAALDRMLLASAVTSEVSGRLAGLLCDAFERIHAVHDPAAAELRGLLGEYRAAAQRTRLLGLAAMALVAALALFMAWLLVRAIVHKLHATSRVCDEIAAGRYDGDVALAPGGDEIDGVLRSVCAMRDTLRRQTEAERAQARITQRMSQALDSSSTSIMVADEEGKIAFMNRSALTLFRAMDGELRGSLPRYPGADSIVGSSFDIFHRNATQQRNLLDGLKSGHTAVIPLASRRMQISAYPVLASGGERLGTAVEWVDRTAELAGEKEVETVISAAGDGDLSKRLVLDGKSGFLLTVSRQVNGLLETNQKVFGEVQRVFAALAGGHLDQHVDGEYKGEFARVKADANATVAKLVEMVQNIQMTADLVNSSALQLASGNENLAQRTTEQAASLEETAASMEELTSTVRHNADNAAEANQVSTATRALAEKGGQVVGRAVQAMKEINESSKRIADIIGVIDEIAFQTNLLALNAAVEAARAGEQGKGFAVVATEVRNLARRSAESAKEIKTLIEDSVRKVEGGSQLVDESGRTLGEIVSSVKRVTDLIAEISAASREQATGVEEVNKAVTQMDQVTTQNAALVDESNMATGGLVGQAKSLSELLAFFSIGAQQAHAGAAAPTVAAAAREAPARPVATARASAPARPAAPRAAGGTRKVPVAPRQAVATGTHEHTPAAAASSSGFKDDGDDWSTF